MRELTNAEFLSGLKACKETLAALKLAMTSGQKLTELQQVEAVSSLDLIKRQVDYLTEDFSIINVSTMLKPLEGVLVCGCGSENCVTVRSMIPPDLIIGFPFESLDKEMIAVDLKKLEYPATMLPVHKDKDVKREFLKRKHKVRRYES